MHLRIISRNEYATVSLGRFLGANLPSCVLALDGDLGVGKTHFVAGVAEGLGYRGHVSSPTFTLVSEYDDEDVRLPLYHMDAYRLPSAEAFFDAGLDEYFARGGICMIEWASLVRPALPTDAIQLYFVRSDEQEDGDADQDLPGGDSAAIQIELPLDLSPRQIDMDWPDLPQFSGIPEHLIEAIKEGSISGLELL